MRLEPIVHRVAASALACLLAAATTLYAQDRPIIVLDPGHGGAVAGVVEGGAIEKDLVLRIAFVAAAELVKHGYDVRLTRTGDYAVSGDDRRRIAEEAGAALLLMLHTNRNDDPARHGAEIYANLDSPANARAAEVMAEALREAGSAVVVEARPAQFLRSPSVPTLMIELAFLTHPVERRLLQSDAFHRELGMTFARVADRLLGPRR